MFSCSTSAGCQGFFASCPWEHRTSPTLRGNVNEHLPAGCLLLVVQFWHRMATFIGLHLKICAMHCRILLAVLCAGSSPAMLHMMRVPLGLISWAAWVSPTFLGGPRLYLISGGLQSRPPRPLLRSAQVIQTLRIPPTFAENLFIHGPGPVQRWKVQHLSASMGLRSSVPKALPMGLGQ